MDIKDICDKCGGYHIVKAGFSQYNTQKYQCQHCTYKFSNTGLDKGRQQINFICSCCGKTAIAKQLCRSCYMRYLRELQKQNINKKYFRAYKP